MEGLLERLGRLSLQKAGKLAKTGGAIGGAALGSFGGPMGAYAGQEAGKAVGGSVKALTDALAQSGQGRVPQGGAVGNLQSFQPQQSFAGRFAGNLGEELGSQGMEAATDYAKGLMPAQTGLPEGTPEEEKSVAQQLEELLDSLSPEDRASILAKYTGAQ